MRKPRPGRGPRRGLVVAGLAGLAVAISADAPPRAAGSGPEAAVGPGSAAPTASVLQSMSAATARDVQGAIPAALPPIVAVDPAPNSLDASRDATITATFQAAPDPSVLTSASVSVFGRWSGIVTGRVETGGASFRFVPDRPFFAGETVTVSIHPPGGVARETGDTAAYTWSFWVRPAPGSLDLTDIGRRSVRRPGDGRVQAYGAYAGDFNGDGFPDLAVPNELANDVRVFLNDGSGNYETFSTLPIPGGAVPSPNEGADFNRDGIVDFAVGNAGNDLVSLFIGDGAGGFEHAGNYEAAREVRGVCILDLNGDGFPDIATANMRGGNRSGVTVLLNDGTGRMGRARPVRSTANGHKTCAAADANGDGITDLFVGAFQTSDVVLFLGDGKGGLAPTASVPAGGQPWMIVAGDADGDGDVDVFVANRNGSNVAVIKGDGRGGMSRPVTYPVGDSPLAVDVGDIDGDGDLDVVSSDLNGRTFTIYENAGNGSLIRPRTLAASDAGSCAVIHDRDGDGDMDITGVDELDDLIFLFENPGRR